MAVDLLREKYPQYRAMGLDRDRAIVIRISPERTTVLELGGVTSAFSICRPAGVTKHAGLAGLPHRVREPVLLDPRADLEIAVRVEELRPSSSSPARPSPWLSCS